MEPSIHLEERRERRGRRIPALATLAVITLLASSLYGLFWFMEANAAFSTVLDLEEEYLCDVEDMALDLPDIGSLSEVQTSDGVLLGKLTARNSQPVAFERFNFPGDLSQFPALDQQRATQHMHGAVILKLQADGMVRDFPVKSPEQGLVHPDSRQRHLALLAGLGQLGLPGGQAGPSNGGSSAESVEYLDDRRRTDRE